MSESFGLLLLAGVSIAFLWAPPGVLTPVVPPTPSAENEVDPTRWRHNGEQPLVYRDGNQSPIEDEQINRLVLAF